MRAASPHVLITGASSGIGEALAREFAGRGAHITLVARRQKLLKKIAGELGTKHNVLVADLSDTAHATNCIKKAEKVFGPVNILVNNAGIAKVCSTPQMDPAAGEKIISLDLLTPLRLCIAVLPRMLTLGGGTIVNIASTAALAPAPSMIHYDAAKAGLACASEALRGELRGSGVNVVTVYPGPIRTALEAATVSAYEDTGSVRNLPTGTPEELARLVCLAVESGKARVIYPRVYYLFRLFPSLSGWLVNRLTPQAIRGCRELEADHER